MRKLLLLSALICLTISSFAQIEIDQSYTIEEYVNDILLGSGISASNISFTGSEVQIGFLTGGEGTIFPMDAGLVLSSEHAINLQQAGADGLPADDVIPAGEEVSGEPDLLTIANSVPPLIGESFSVGSVNDVAILEFDFIATGDTMSFNYSFGSDEYLTFINTQYNDIFAFFLSGPGITGPYASPAGFPDGAMNIAQVPDTDPPLPITISSVNPGSYAEYYIDNPFPNVDIDQNGFTTKLTAIANVICGETYHIKLAIGDGSDTALESVVILESGSFSSNSVVEVELSIDVGGPDADTFYEDCGEALLTFTRPIETILEVEEYVIIDYSGSTATNGLDYTLLPDSVFFEPFVTEVSFPLDAFEDGLVEGQEMVVMEILNVAACGGTGLTTFFEFFINDEPEPLIVDGYTEEICLGDTITLAPLISGGYGNYLYDWDTGQDTPTIDVNPALTTTYNVIVGDTCGMPSDGADITINVAEFPPFEVVIDNGDVELNCGEFVEVLATASGGDGNYSNWLWTNEDGVNLFGWDNSLFYSTWSGAEQIIVSVQDGCGFTATDTVDVILDVPTLEVTMVDSLEVGCNEQFTLVPDIVGGAEPFFYNWYVNGFWTDWAETFTYSTDVDVEISVDISDNCGQTENFVIPINVVVVPIEITMEDYVTGPCTEVFVIDPTVTGGNNDFDYSWTNSAGTTVSTSTALNYSSEEDQTFTLTVEDSCGGEATAQVEVDIENPEVTVDLGGDINASCIDNTEVTADVLTGAGGYGYTWSVDGNTEATGASNTFSWQTYVTQQVNVDVVDACGGAASDSLMIVIPNIPLSITTTPDTAICIGQDVELNVEAFGGEGGFTYYWDEFAQASPTVSFTPSGPGTYSVAATDVCGYVVEAEIEVDVQDVTALFQVTYMTDTEVQFTATPVPEAQPDFNFYWDFGDGATSEEENPLHTYDGLDQYLSWMTVVNGIGCRDSVSILIDSPISLYVPNAFTPNNDGINDVWALQGAGISEFEIIVFNRWGDVVYQSSDLSGVWLGDNQGTGEYYVPDGVYPWLIKLKGNDTEAFERRGQVTVTR